MNLYRDKTNELVPLPSTLTDFRGDERIVERIEQDARPGSSGKVLTSEGRIFYPGVFRCYIADEPKETEE